MPTWSPTSGNNYNLAANWNTGVIPTTITDAVFDGSVSNANCVINAVNLTCLNWSFQNAYNGVITVNNNFIVRGNITLLTTANFAGVGAIVLQTTAASATLTSNGKALNLPLVTNSSVKTYTVVDDWTVASFVTNYINTGAVLFNSGRIFVSGNFTHSANGGTVPGTTEFIIIGTGTVSCVPVVGGFPNPITFDTVGTVTLGQFNFSTGCVIKYVNIGTLINSPGLITSTGTGQSLTLDTNNYPFADMILRGNTVVTLLSNANFNNVTLGGISGGTVLLINGVGLRLNCRGNLTVAQNGGITGTAILAMTGTGNLSDTTAFATRGFRIDFEINTPGVITVISNLFFSNGKTITYTSGTVNVGLTTININGNTTINTSGINWYNLTVASVTNTITTNQALNISNNLLIQNNITFDGSNGWNCTNLLCSVAGSAITLQSGVTYTTSNSVNLLGTNASRISMVSSSASTRAIWTLINGASQSVVYVNGTRIDSSQGQTIWSFGGVLNDTINWNIGSRPSPISFMYIG